jgi:hypothetical protein
MKNSKIKFWFGACFILIFLLNIALIFLSLAYQLALLAAGAILISVFQIWVYSKYSRKNYLN